MPVDFQPEEEPAASAWQRLLQAVLILFLVIAVLDVTRCWFPVKSEGLEPEVRALRHQVEELEQEQAMPSFVLNRYRDSICYIFGIYEIGFPHHRALTRTRISGTGFVVADGLIATNRHVAEPWYGDPESDALLSKGASASLEKMVAYFPGSPAPVNLTSAALSSEGDLAIVRMSDGAASLLRPLPLASEKPNPGELVAVVGYPMGVLGMMAKAPTPVYARLVFRHDEQGTASELAALSLIRPSATCGHLGDVVGDKLIYDAPTAHGASGGPVFNSRGEVIGVNAAYIDGFSGGTLGISSQALKALIAQARQRKF
ncbi:MAG: trypsin-like peptidase domain-containing protein [Acidobacteria bacterium]|nr:trypsin-like peptidase domain-containing protein [Acidobacteriota bacterium]